MVPDLPAVIGHRGACAAAPENTLASFRTAAEQGARWVEFDVRLSADGRCVLLHDDTLDRTTSGRGRADLLRLAELKAHDAGAWFGPGFSGERIPTLEETIELLASLDLGANVEIKPAPGAEIATAEAVVTMLRESWPAHLPPPLLSSFKPEALAAAKQAAPEIARGFLCSKLGSDWKARAEALGCVTIHTDHRKLSAASVREVCDAGYPLLAYTVNDPARARELFAWGVSAVFSDCPGRLMGVAGLRE
jgi:glycerophosphoryl diester phosphodiesterase